MLPGSDASIEAPQTLHLYASRLLQERAVEDAAAAEVDGALLYLDIVDSTGLTERYAALGADGAERLGEVLGGYFRLVFAAIAERDGDIVGMEGDSVLALWRDEPSQPSAAERAADAALALRERLVGAPITQRILVASGRLSVMTLKPRSDRRILLLGGPPIRALAAAAAACPPGGVILPLGVVPRPGFAAARSVPVCSEIVLAPFLPPIVVERVKVGHGYWLAEFRTLTSIMIRLEGVEAEAAGGTLLESAVGAVDAALAGVGLAIAEVVEGDKGTVLRFAAGLPPYVLDDNAVGGIEAARLASKALRGVGIVAGVGVATGRAFTVEVGDEHRRLYAILGPVMNRAARLMQMANGEVLACDSTAAAAKDRFDFAEPFMATMKGQRALAPVHRLLGRRAPRPVGYIGAGLYGRDTEVALLGDFLDRLRGDSGRLAVIEGEPGAGKSRLLAHVGTLARQRGRAIFIGAAQSIEQETSYFAFRQVLAQLLGGEPDQELEVSAATRRLRSLLNGSPLAQRAEALTDLLTLDLAMLDGSERLTGAARRGAIASLLAHLLEATPTRAVVLLDDAQWLDASSVRLLETLLHRVPGLLAVAGARPLEPHARPELRAFLRASPVQARLERLNQASIGELIRTTLGGATVPRRLVEHIHTRSEGLPLFAEQLVLAMRDQMLLRPSPDGRRVEADLDAHAEVATLRDVILRRVGLLPSGQQTLLKLASVLGRGFDPALLESIHPDSPTRASLESELSALAEAGLLERQGTQLTFHHIRIQEAVYDLLPFAQRRVLHRAVAMAIEAAYSADLAPYHGQLAAHWEQAQEPARGAAYRLRAASRALNSFANLEVLAQLGAIERAGGNDALLPAQSDRAEFARLWGAAAQELSSFDDARHWLMRCAILYGVSLRHGKAALLGGVGIEIFRQLLLRAGVSRARSDADAMARDALSAFVHIRLAEHAYHDGDSLSLLHNTLVALNRAETGRNSRDLVGATGGLALGLGVAGFRRLAEYYRRRALTIAETTQPWDQAVAVLLGAVLSTHFADWPSTEAMAARAAAIFDEIGEQDRYVTCQAVVAFARIAAGDIPNAELCLADFGEFAESVDNPRVGAWVLAARAQIDLMVGAPPTQALERLAGVREEWQSAGEKTLARGLRAAAALASGNRAQAVAAADDCMAVMRHTLPVALTYHGAAAMAAACLGLAEAAPADAAARARAREAVRLVRAFAKRAPVSECYALWLAGRAAELSGQRGRAAKLFRKGFALAERLNMPVEAGLCLRAMGDAGAAKGIFERTGCVPWLEFASGAAGT
jgi:class 3 adenylate cyclase